MTYRSLIGPSVLLLVLAVCSVPVAASPTYTEPAPRELRSVPDTHPMPYLAARDHLLIGDTDEAGRLLRQSLRQFPYHGPSVTLFLKLRRDEGGTRAVYRTVREQFQRTEQSELFLEYLRSVPGSTEPFVPILQWLNERDVRSYSSRVLARRYLDRGDLNRADDVLRKALKAFPDDLPLRLLEVETTARLGQCDRALERVNRLLRRRPGRPEPYRLKAALLPGDRQKTVRQLLETAGHLSGSEEPADPESLTEITCSGPGDSSKDHS